MRRIVLDLHYFDEGGAPAGGTGGDAGAIESSPRAAEITEVQIGDSLPNGQKVESAKVAAELNRQMKRNPGMRKAIGQGRTQETQPAGKAPAEGQGAQAQPDEKTIQQRWDELKKGEFKDLYGQDVQAAIKDRFKNQADANDRLTKMQPMLDALMKKTGAQNEEELQKLILDDDSLYEEEAEAAGMSVESFKQLKALETENARLKSAEQQSLEQQMLRNHYQSLVQQGEELKRVYPGFDLQEELKNPDFMRMTGPNVGISVKDAFFAVHHDELQQQMLQAGMERAQKQLGETIKAQGRRPVEGAAHGQGQGEVQHSLDFRTLTPKEREEIRNRVKAGRLIIPTR